VTVEHKRLFNQCNETVTADSGKPRTYILLWWLVDGATCKYMVTTRWCPWVTSHCDSHHKWKIVIHTPYIIIVQPSISRVKSLGYLLLLWLRLIYLNVVTSGSKEMDEISDGSLLLLVSFLLVYARITIFRLCLP